MYEYSQYLANIKAQDMSYSRVCVYKNLVSLTALTGVHLPEETILLSDINKTDRFLARKSKFGSWISGAPKHFNVKREGQALVWELIVFVYNVM